jgi:general secretion pathway protein F/type IV pilus assembly protein PilC
MAILGILYTVHLIRLANELFKEALLNATNDISRGSQLSVSFAKTKMFTTFMIRMMGVGESSGTLEAQLNIIAEHYYEKVDNYAENIGKIIEPVVLIVVGGFARYGRTHGPCMILLVDKVR